MFASDPQRLARCEREAKVLASLTHPSLASIYGLEQAHGVRFLVLELAEAQTLAQRLRMGPLPVDDALEGRKAADWGNTGDGVRHELRATAARGR